jgi:sugar phosphate permease
MSSVTQTYRRIGWRLLPFLMLCYVIFHLDRINVGFAQLQMREVIGLSDAAFGLGVAAAALAMMLFEIPSNLILLRVGIQRTLSRIMLLWGMAAMATAFVRTPLQFCIVRFLVGAFAAGLLPGITYYLTLWFPVSQRARAMAVLMLSFVIAGTIAGPLSGWMMSGMEGRGGLGGWQWMLILQGAPACIVGLLARYFLPDQPQTARWLDPDEVAVVEAVVKADQARWGQEPTPSLAAALRNPRVQLLSAMSFCILFCTGSLTYWLPTVIRGLGETDLRRIGLLAALPYLMGGLAMVYWGSRSDRRLERRWHFSIAMLIAGTGFALLTQSAETRIGGYAGLLLASIGLMSALPVFWSLTTAIFKERSAAVSIALINSIGMLGSAVSAVLIGRIVKQTGGIDAAFYPCIALTLASVAMMQRAVRGPAAAVAGDR